MSEKNKSLLMKSLFGFLGVVLLVLIWEVIYWLAGKETFPGFFATVREMFVLLGEKKVYVALGHSLLRIIVTLAIVFLAGNILGLLAAYFPPLERILAPVIYFLTAFPTASMIFVLIIYTKITCQLLVAFLTFPIIYKAALGGGKEVIRKYQKQMLVDGFYSNKGNFFEVLVPLSWPYMFIGLSQATGLSLKAEIMGEVFMSSSHFVGVGKMIRSLFDAGEVSKMFGLTLVSILMLALVDFALYFLKKHLKAKYAIEENKVFHWY